MGTRVPLEQVRIGMPCSQPWAEMTGDDRVRFCPQCRKHVHHLSAMSRIEVQELVCRGAGNLCVRYQPDASGAPLTLEYASLTTPSRRRRLWPIACLVALAAGVLSFVRKPAPPPIIMGEMMIAPVQTSTSPSPTQ